MIGTTEAEIKTIKDKAEKERRTKQIETAKKIVLTEIIRDAKFHLPEAMTSTFSKQSASQIPTIGLSYGGQSFEKKRKCPICEAVYIFPMAMNAEVEKLKQDWKVVGETDPNKVNSRRGCCAEAIAFVQCLKDLKIFSACFQYMMNS